jgi:acetyl-CoA acetyltransferase
VIAGGVEHMTRSPWIISKTSTPFGRDAEMFDSSFGWRFVNPALKAAMEPTAWVKRLKIWPTCSVFP